MKRIFRSFVVLFLAVVLTITFMPCTSVSAKHREENDDYWNYWGDDWEDTEDETQAVDYLVLVGQSNGSYVAYSDIAFVTGGNHVMVKAKPLATALGMSYQTNSGHKQKKGITLSLGQDKNVYIRNSKTYYFLDYNSATMQTSQVAYNAEYKQMVYENYNAVHCATLSTLVNYQYYDTRNNSSYANLGYCGVVVYNKYAGITRLPDITNVSNFDGYIPNNNQNNNNNNNNNNTGTINVTIKPVLVADVTYPDIKNIDASYSITQATNQQILDLTEVLNTFKAYNLPYNGIYGCGNCDTAITIQAYDKNGYLVAENKTTGNEFLMNFPTATKLIISGDVKNLVLDFTPILPTLITDNARIPFNQISWAYQSDGYARYYVVLADYMRLSTENVTSAYALSRKFLSTGSYTNPDYAASYQRITAVFKSPYTELISPNCYINIQKTGRGINNSLVVFNDTGTAVLAADYEAKLLSMITTLNKTGLNIYFPSKNWNRQLVMKLPDNTVNTAYSYITVDPSYLNLDHFFDYYFTLHEMVHFYEATQPHYGFRFEAWTEGNATTLAIKTMDALSVTHKDTNGNDYIAAMYSTDYSFLTQDNKSNFEAYYLNVTGWNAALIGYHFTEFLRDMYGSDIVYRIMEKVYAANIPTTAGRNSTYDKQFTDCIKSATSQNVFQLFVEYCVNKK
ncbi:MAG TPA: hypothetical protein VN258_09660 [Mobilitalea sp.]|nr:hypothetical protein [Mobilitalea sp.]